jgi:hypothetical protein
MNPKTTAVVLIEYQNDEFVSSLAKAEAEKEKVPAGAA